MALPPPRQVVAPLAAPQHFMAPSPRELRAQAVKRLQIGLFGLAAIVLLIGLANIINDRARLAAAEQARSAPLVGAGSSAAAMASASATKADPLADAGVVPSNAASAKPALPAVPAAH